MCLLMDELMMDECCLTTHRYNLGHSVSLCLLMELSHNIYIYIYIYIYISLQIFFLMIALWFCNGLFVLWSF